jgi:hypothetical protein
VPVALAHLAPSRFDFALHLYAYTTRTAISVRLEKKRTYVRTTYFSFDFTSQYYAFVRHACTVAYTSKSCLVASFLFLPGCRGYTARFLTTVKVNPMCHACPDHLLVSANRCRLYCIWMQENIGRSNRFVRYLSITTFIIYRH